MPHKFDIALWHECVRAVPRRPIPPHMLPFRCKDVDGNRVLVVDAHIVMTTPDKPEDSEHPHMDFTQGANDLEAAWVRREFGKKVLLLDNRMPPPEWPFDLYHEGDERRLLAKGMSYNRAHNLVNPIERMLRITVKGGQRATQRTA